MRRALNMMAASSFASANKASTDDCLSSPPSAINSIQRPLSSASSKTVPNFAANSALERARQAARVAAEVERRLRARDDALAHR